jgi:hypothetical protein
MRMVTQTRTHTHTHAYIGHVLLQSSIVKRDEVGLLARFGAGRECVVLLHKQYFDRYTYTPFQTCYIPAHLCNLISVSPSVLAAS